MNSFASEVPRPEAENLYPSQRPITLSAGTEPSATAAYQTIPSWYVLGTRNRIITPAAQLSMATRAHSRITRIEAGHLGLITESAAVTKVIEQAARATRRGHTRSAGRSVPADRDPGCSVLGVRAIEYSVTGDPDVLTLVDRPMPEPGPGEVRVRIYRSGVNPTDWKTRRGSAPGTRVDPPQVPNQDGSGVIDAVGQGVDAALVGRRVWIWEAAHQRPSGGTAQEYTVVPVRHVVPLADGASYDLGAALGVPFLTAHRCLTVTEDGPERLGPGKLAGRTVLVAGGAGAVGNAAIQLARWSDATVITTVSSPEKGNLAALAGADHVINYKQEDVVKEVRAIAPQGVNIIVEVSPAMNASIDHEVIAMHGAVAVYATDGGNAMEVPVRPLMVPNARWQFVLLYTAPDSWRPRGLDDVAAAVESGAVRVGPEAGLPLHHYPLERAAEAHAAAEQGAVGKVLIDVAD